MWPCAGCQAGATDRPCEVQMRKETERVVKDEIPRMPLIFGVPAAAVLLMIGFPFGNRSVAARGGSLEYDAT